VGVDDPAEAGGRGLERVLPRRGVELAVLTADERLRQSIGVVHEVEGEPPLYAEVALVREVLVLRGHLHDVLRLGIEVEVDLATDAAERARRPHLLEFALRA
jgi:hypothetical protein